MKAIDLCIARFDEDTKEAFLDLYTKVDSGMQFDEDGKEISKPDHQAPGEEYEDGE